MLVARSDTNETAQADSKDAYQAQLTHTKHTTRHMLGPLGEKPCDTLVCMSQIGIEPRRAGYTTIDAVTGL